MRAAIVLRQGADQRAALAVLRIAAAFELLLFARHAIEIAAHLLDRRGDRPALRRQRREQREEAFAGTAGFVRLRHGAVEIGLLFGDRFVGALDLLGAGRVGRALVDGSKLRLQAYADRI